MDPSFSDESDSLVKVDINLVVSEIYHSNKEKEKRTPYNTKKISDMWRYLNPPSMARLCEEVSKDGWTAGFRECIRVTRNTIEEIVDIIIKSGYLGAEEFIRSLSNIGWFCRRACYSQTFRIVSKSVPTTTAKCIIFWECTANYIGPIRQLCVECFLMVIT